MNIGTVAFIKRACGRYVIIKTSQEMLFGRLKMFYESHSVLELTDLFDINRNFAYIIPQKISHCEILIFHVISHRVLMLPDTSLETGNSLIEFIPKYGYGRLSLHELKIIPQLLNSIIVITQCDRIYHDALNDIMLQDCVSLIVPQNFTNTCDQTQASVIVIATEAKVYIFDIVSLGKVFKGLEAVFSAARPRKIVHCSNNLVKIMKQWHQIGLSSINDTFVAYCNWRGSIEPITLISAIGKVLFIPAKLFEYTNDHDSSNSVTNFHARPLNQKQILGGAKLAIFQRLLYNHLKDYMIHNFTKQCQLIASGKVLLE